MKSTGWKFEGNQGVFKISHPEHHNYLYFPLVNEAGMMSAVTPNLHGEMTSSHNTFFMSPVSVEDLHNSKSARNFWVHVDGHGAWSVTGNSAKQNASRFMNEEEESQLEAGFLWHKLTRINGEAGLQAEVTSFVPVTDDQIELMKVKLTNVGEQTLKLTPTAAIPLYGRSADDLRDHRHVTSLLHRIFVHRKGIEVQPALSFDERGHRINHVSYSVLGAEADGAEPIGYFPVLEEFIGEGGALDWPEAVIANKQTVAQAGDSLAGYEAIGGLRFAGVQLQPGESRAYVMAMVISEGRAEIGRLAETYLSERRFDELLAQNEAYWNDKLNTVSFQTGDQQQDLWMKWVTLQPILRRLYGNSFLPYHDYGRGGRGWRDLWQDCLALMIMEPSEVRYLLLNNYAGVRIDGSNATIIGTKPGEFIADRNNIPRVWMDHGAWPFMTTLLYMDQSGDLDFLKQPQTYFRDIFVKRCQEKDIGWLPEHGNQLLTVDGEVYEGTILEHMLLQNLVPFFNVGEHNNIKLEGADWNDGLDLAPDRGESVAFTAFYASNLMQLGDLLLAWRDSEGVELIEIAEEMAVLLDSLTAPVSYDDVQEKLGLLDQYYESVKVSVTGNKRKFSVVDVVQDLRLKADWIIRHLRSKEWMTSQEGYSWFNGYYNNDGERVEGDHPLGVRMTLTGQVFAIMGGIADNEQVGQITKAVDRYLKDPSIGYRLNSNFGEIQQNLGRAFGFAFGHKENGAMFSHMSVMYANALYKRGFVREGYEVLQSIYDLSNDFERSRMYPGIPEYINEKGRGMYPYLTGSASWLLLTMLTEVFGVKGNLGHLLLEPKIRSSQFGADGTAVVHTWFVGKELQIVYSNPMRLDYGSYTIQSVTLNGEKIQLRSQKQESAELDRSLLSALSDDECQRILVELA
ncbi:GH36-type glycosyl hydrolase domain-containing protein [Paenibacillus lautus]|uniref:GH36-type glycosyl hydrolase domain-containing protein n=1 Tax=Paenibacillus lautus TaxID=1401 RepID=UPI001C121BE4|nr:cellobiose phosphorylase [Paenibacillus lautus]MBU5344920.1 cellobiose phosphorylase [Paenibacillus lautus]